MLRACRVVLFFLLSWFLFVGVCFFVLCGPHVCSCPRYAFCVFGYIVLEEYLACASCGVFKLIVIAHFLGGIFELFVIANFYRSLHDAQDLETPSVKDENPKQVDDHRERSTGESPSQAPVINKRNGN